MMSSQIENKLVYGYVDQWPIKILTKFQTNTSNNKEVTVCVCVCRGAGKWGVGGRPSQHSTKNSPAWIGLTLSLKRDGCEVVAVSPFRIFPRAVLAFFPRIAIRSIYQHFVLIPLCLRKKSSKNFAVKKVGGRRDCTTPRPEREGVAAKIKKML